MTTYTEASVLDYHGIAPLMARDAERIDAARDHGVLHICLGCGSIVVAPEGYTTEDYLATLGDLEIDFSCCGDSIVY